MALFNDAKREINAKIVYIGPKGAGKGSALRQIYGKLKPESRSELKSMAIGGHQMLFFDFSYASSLRADGYSVRFHLYTILVGEGAPPPWKMLLKGVDGVVLFADSTDGRMYSNLESCAVLMDSIAHYGRKMEDIALSLQCNKRDLKGALPLETMRSELLPEAGICPFPVTATTGEGLLEGLDSVVREILNNLGQEEAVESLCQQPAPERITVELQQAGDGAGEEFDHCTADSPALSVETAGDPVMLDSSTVVIPLRLTGGACGKSAEFKVTVSVSM
jgi:signal recognition particle receptor subunit beta